jgi:transcriptional regulator with XRE-family HTH domain
MVERIRTLLEVRQLTPTQFADAIGIARPIVSHILSGRNKPSLEVVQRILAAMPDLSMPWLLNGTGPMLAGAEPTASPVPVPTAAPAPVKEAQEVDEEVEKRIPNPAVVVPEVTNTPAATQPRRRPTPPIAAFPAKAPIAAPRPAIKRFAPAAMPKPTAAPADAVVQPAPEPTPQPIAAPNPPTPAVIPPVEPVLPAQPAPPAAIPVVDSSATAAALFARAEKPIRRIVIFYRDGSFADYHPE